MLQKYLNRLFTVKNCQDLIIPCDKEVGMCCESTLKLFRHLFCPPNEDKNPLNSLVFSTQSLLYLFKFFRDVYKVFQYFVYKLPACFPAMTNYSYKAVLLFFNMLLCKKCTENNWNKVTGTSHRFQCCFSGLSLVVFISFQSMTFLSRDKFHITYMWQLLNHDAHQTCIFLNPVLYSYLDP